LRTSLSDGRETMWRNPRYYRTDQSSEPTEAATPPPKRGLRLAVFDLCPACHADLAPWLRRKLETESCSGPLARTLQGAAT
jgi:hypothetical protein